MNLVRFVAGACAGVGVALTMSVVPPEVMAEGSQRAPAASQTGPGQGQAGPAQSQPDATRTIAGVVQSVQESTMTVKAASGETVVVDLSRLSPNVQELVLQGERVTVLGVMGPRSDVLTAQGVVARGQTDPESGSALPRDAARPAGSTGQVPDAVERTR